MKKKINIGIIGKNFGYQVIYNSFILNKKFNVIGFSSRSNDFNTTNIPKNIKIYNNWKQLIDDKKIDAVVIAIPPFYHKEIIKYAIKKNKHIFCEKPVGISIKEVSDLIKIIKNKKLAHIVNFEFPKSAKFANRPPRRLRDSQIDHIFGPASPFETGSFWASKWNPKKAGLNQQILVLNGNGRWVGHQCFWPLMKKARALREQLYCSPKQDVQQALRAFWYRTT